VLIPVGLVVPEGSYEHDPSAGTVDQQAIQLTGRHAVREDEKDSSLSSPFAPAFGDPAKNGRSAAEPGPSFREDPGSLAYLEEPGSLAFPQEPESLTYPGAPGPLGYPEAPGPFTYADEGGSLAYPDEPRSLTFAEESGSLAYPEEAEDWSAARVPPKPDPVGSDDLIEGELPRRIRQASLAPQLRDSSGHIDTRTDSNSADARSPEEARATVSAIQQGWQRGRSLFDPSDKGTVKGTAPSGDDGMQQNDD
jgi:hypothetical protein